ncbi:MAG: hypothetical protein ACI9GK_003143 [Devosia sp.]|jgi:hypothetical protein|tara:strand:- start:2358 stop:2576 length:219 start_codon:yes stop_codon:yes gene_type:complete
MLAKGVEPVETPMAEIINLQKVRKQRARADKAEQAEQNRIKFGRTKAEKQLTAAEQALADKRIDGHKRDDED